MELERLLQDRVTRLVGPEFQACEAAIAGELKASPLGLIRDMVAHVTLAGGKRLRPILLLLAGRLGMADGARVGRLGCVVELLHTATLIHDDVVDGATMRRGRSSANALWGDDASVLVGDHLYSRCMSLLVADGDVRVMDALASAMVSMTEAEVFQLERKRARLLSERDYLRIIRQKTATLIAACCRVGGLAGGLAPQEVEALGGYGEQLGIAFQIIDDSLDFGTDEARLGKTVGADLREGKRTLPLIVTLERATGAERARITSILGREGSTDADVAEVRDLVKVYDGVGYAVSQAHSYATAAMKYLKAFTPSETTETLQLIADYVVRRDR